jgi:hypothetical protein
VIPAIDPPSQPERRLSAKTGNIWSVYSRKNDFRRAVATAEDRLVAAMRVGAACGAARRRRSHGGNRRQGGIGRLTCWLIGTTPSAPAINRAESPSPGCATARTARPAAHRRQRQFMAGERLRVDYERARMERRITSSWEMPIDAGSGGSSMSDNRIATLTDNALAARQHVSRALQAVGPELGGILIEICCLAAGIEQAERLLNLPQRSGKAVLALALTSLARHYGLLKRRDAGKRATALHWAMEDYGRRLRRRNRPEACLASDDALDHRGKAVGTLLRQVALRPRSFRSAPASVAMAAAGSPERS